MSVVPQENIPENTEVRVDDSEKNLTKQRKYYEKELEKERSARQMLEEKVSQLAQQRIGKQEPDDDDEPTDEPYVDHRRLQKSQARMEKKIVGETDQRIQNAVQTALAAERQTQWLKNNPDFYEVMNHAQTFADKDPELAETILSMPEGFERQKLVYKNIKALGIHKKPEAQPSIQDKIDQNRRSPFYQPSGMGAAPYGIANGGRDVSPAEGQNAYKKMKELQARLRI
jgi:hypothetical protein